MEKKLVAELEKTASPEYHYMVAIGRTIYISDGNKVWAMETPMETIWQKMGRFFGLVK